MNYDFLGIGDTVTDAFIHLKEADVHCGNHKDKEICELSIRFKEKIPYEEHYIIPAVGNSANATVAAARLGLSTALVSDVGDDYFGTECLNALGDENVHTEFVRVHRGKKTNYHYVLWYKDDRTILIKHNEYPYELKDIDNPRWIYLSSLGEHSADYHGQIEKYLHTHPDVRLAFQPGTFQIRFGAENLKGIYSRAEVLLCNKEEAEAILKKSGPTPLSELIRGLHYFGPKIVVITDGPSGAYASDGRIIKFMPSYPDPKPPLERTGAGDAFSSTLVAALASGFGLDEALRWAPINSMSVVQKVGARAGLLHRAGHAQAAGELLDQDPVHQAA